MIRFPYIKTAHTQYRHRGFFCAHCARHSLILGDDPTPTICPNCNSIGQLKKEWDHLITETIYVKDYVPPGDSIDAGVSGAI